MFLFIFYFFLCYLLYRLIFNFILPIYRTTRQVKRSFRDMNERMQGAGNNNQQAPHPEEKKRNTDGVGEYIDFEEVP
ncbi:MAG: hypothetical protein C4329_10540 [Chitinophagaceae bacterium]